MAERKVDWGMQAGYKLSLRLGPGGSNRAFKVSQDCDMHYCGLAIERSEGLMSCTKSYGKSIVELLIRTTSFKKI